MVEKPKQNEQTAFSGFKNQPEQIQDTPMKQLGKKAKGFEPPNLGNDCLAWGRATASI